MFLDTATVYENRETGRIVRIIKIDERKTYGKYILVEYLKYGTSAWFSEKDFIRLFKAI